MQAWLGEVAACPGDDVLAHTLVQRHPPYAVVVEIGHKQRCPCLLCARQVSARAACKRREARGEAEHGAQASITHPEIVHFHIVRVAEGAAICRAI